MIDFFYEVEFGLDSLEKYSHWVNRIIKSEEKVPGNINFIFCNDDYLFGLNQEYLNHDTLTDIITFDYSDKKELSGDIFISIERVKDNAKIFNTSFQKELLRVMAHGVLHLVGYNDKTIKEIGIMRGKENEKIELFHVEQK